MHFKDIRTIVNANNQSHLLKFWDELTDDQREDFTKYLKTIPFDEYTGLFKRAIDSLTEDVQKLDSRMQPIPAALFETEEGCSPETVAHYRSIGLKEISEGHVAVLLMAGGQGTRLGVTYPKGMYSVGLPSGKTLFQIQAERIRRIQKLAEEQFEKKGKVLWYIMTSGPTTKATKEFMESHSYFGLRPEDVIFFEQSLLPCFDFEGKIIMEDKDKICFAPDGNGGIYGALKKNGILDHMESKGVHFVHAHSVDNILVKVADPVFIGYCVSMGADCGAKVVSKNSPSEAVGVVCQVDGRFQVVEYSEITEKTANLRDADGNLVFSAGNICNHFFTTKFLRDVAENYEHELKLHVAKKKIPHIDGDGVKVTPKAPNGIKIEKFIFDAFQFSRHFVTWEVPRDSEFSALKNSDDVGKDCPSTAKRDLLALHKKYILKAGGVMKCDEVEISPLLSYAGEDLEAVVKDRVFDAPTVLTAEEDHTNGYCNGNSV